MDRENNGTNAERECKQLVGAAFDCIFTLDAHCGWWAVLRFALETLLALVLRTHPLIASSFLAAVVRTACKDRWLFAA